jgi:DNA-binding transcriptional ArsR family regulator
MSQNENHFDSSRAELFEALGHPTRVKILRTLAERPMSFSELKRETGIESSGHLQFHLGKLSSLVKTDAVGNYTLTDEGRDALYVAQAALRSEPSLKRGYVWTRFDTANIAISIVWAVIMVATSLELARTEVGTVILMILLVGFVACLLILSRLGQASVRFDE